MEEFMPDVMEIKTSGIANPMDSEAMSFLYELGKKSRDFKVVEIGGKLYENTREGKLEEIIPYEKPCPIQFEAFTLSGLVKWLHEDVDHLFQDFERLYVHVDNETSVYVKTMAHGRRNGRATVASCCISPPGFPFDKHMPQEDFIIKLQTRFVATPDLDTVAEFVGNIRMEQEAETADDGVSQRVTIKDGVSGLKNTVIRNPFYLAPIRTFDEIEQPESPLVLRIRKANGPEAALFEADGGAWKNEAVKRIGAWLEGQLSDLPVVVIA